MGALSPTHWAIIVILVLLLFGARRLPDMARGVGQSLRILKNETKDLREDGHTTGSAEQPTQAIPPTGQQPQATTAPQAAPAAPQATTGTAATGSTASTPTAAGPTASGEPAAPGSSAGSGTS